MVVLPVQKTKERLFWEQWQEQFAQNEKASNTTKYLFLPEQVGKQKVSYQEKVRQWSSTILLLTCILLLLVPFREGKKLQSAMIKREKQLKMDFPEMIERFTLLVEAGLSVKGALRPDAPLCASVDDVRKEKKKIKSTMYMRK